jgi:hypothetical protein
VSSCHPIVINNRTTAGIQYWYDLNSRQRTLLQPLTLVPVTIVSISGPRLVFSVVKSPNSIPIPSYSLISSHPDSMDRFRRFTRAVEIPWRRITQAFHRGTLVINLTVSVDEAHKITQFHWNFRTHQDLGSGSSKQMPACTTYRGHLLGILSMIYLIHTLEKRSESSLESSPPRKIMIECNHKRALQNAFRRSPIGVRDAVQSNYDIILEIRHWRELLRTSLYPIHSPTQR